MSEIYFTSDNHFGHDNIIKYCKRPYSSIEEMDEDMVKRWNENVGQYDTVYMNGDVGFANHLKLISYLKRLNGVKYLTLGNHDRQIITHRNDFIREKVFAEINYYKEITVSKQHIILCHYAMRVWNRSHHGSWMLFGHTHNTLPPIKNSVDVGVDSTAILNGVAPYRPFSFEEIQRYMKQQPFE